MIRGWFSLVKNTITKYGIVDSDIFDFDETGFMMGIISTGIVVTSTERLSNTKLVQPSNLEWITVIQGVNAKGWTVPPYIIVSGKYHLSTWYQNSTLPHDWVHQSTMRQDYLSSKLGSGLLTKLLTIFISFLGLCITITTRIFANCFYDMVGFSSPY